MKYRLLLTRAAAREIEARFDWLLHRSPTAAGKWKRRIESATIKLVADPHRYPEAPEAQNVGFDLRQMIVGPKRSSARILFIIEKDIVTVLRVRHGFQDLLGPDEL